MLIAMETRMKNSVFGQRLLTAVYKVVNPEETDRYYQ